MGSKRFLLKRVIFILFCEILICSQVTLAWIEPFSTGNKRRQGALKEKGTWRKPSNLVLVEDADGSRLESAWTQNEKPEEEEEENDSQAQPAEEEDNLETLTGILLKQPIPAQPAEEEDNLETLTGILLKQPIPVQPAEEEAVNPKIEELNKKMYKY